jgi:hypothetical protein
MFFRQTVGLPAKPVLIYVEKSGKVSYAHFFANASTIKNRAKHFAPPFPFTKNGTSLLFI